MEEIHVRDLEEIDGRNIESIKIWSDYGINEEMIIKYKDGEERTINCSS